jgi:hypothetical protein
MPVQLKPPSGLPTKASTAEEEAWSGLIAAQLADTRKTAENWRNGLVALIGLIGGFSVIKGSSDLSGLPAWAAYMVGVLLAAALACAVFGAWQSLEAAYGTPGVVTRENFHQAGGMDGLRLGFATQAAARLRLARAATLVTLALLAGAVGLTWYAPRTASVMLNVERKGMPEICGKLKTSQEGYVDLQPAGSGTVRVSLSDMVAVHAVEACP